MGGQEIADLVGSIYDAASGAGDWVDVGDRLTRKFDGLKSHIWVTETDGKRVLLTRAESAGVAAYTTHYHKIDPLVAATKRLMTKGLSGVGMTVIGDQIVDEREYLNSEYYNDYGRRLELRHVVGALVTGPSAPMIDTFRGPGGKAYDQKDADTLNWLLPHFQRALQLRRQLPAPTPSADLGLAALDALPVGVMLVDASMRVLFANAASAEILSGPDAVLRVASSAGRLVPSGAVLTARDRREGDGLRKLVASAAARQPGGAMRMRGSDATASWALVVSPAPTRLTSAKPEASPNGLTDGVALIMMRNLEARHLPSASLLIDLFSLSKAEAEVSVLILGGAKAEDVARARQVSLDTVRSQIRTVLGKTEAQNLRDFERIAASLPFLRSPDGGTGR